MRPPVERIESKRSAIFSSELPSFAIWADMPVTAFRAWLWL
jgi:hypothetical protein